jgi:hypothetical protein
LIGALVLAVLLFVLWRLWPADAVAALRGQPGAQPGAAAAVARSPAAPAENALRVLMVGNSHTYFNDMPSMIAGLASAAHEQRPFASVMLATGGATLAQHLAQGEVSRRLSAGRWDYVVLQEQQQRPAFTFNPRQMEEQFFAPIRTLDVIAKAAGARTVLYMNWARRAGDPSNVPGDDYEKMQERTRESFATAAQQIGAAVAPVGLAWRAGHRDHPEIALWAPDGSHANRPGSYLAACVLYGVLYGRSALGNAYTAGLAADVARHLQVAADAAPR